MTRLRAEDLPPALRRQIERMATKPLPERIAVPPRVERGTNHWQCAACGETFTAWSRAEKHSDEHQHHRIELDVTREDG